MTNSTHYQRDRRLREYIIHYIIGEGTVIKEVYEEGKYGMVKHLITNTGIAIICSADEEERIITKRIIRPTQLKHYYGDEEIPTYLMALCVEHKRKHYNEA